jgi:hypothetical protein
MTGIIVKIDYIDVENALNDEKQGEIWLTSLVKRGKNVERMSGISLAG